MVIIGNMEHYSNIDKDEIVSDIFEAYCANTDDYMGAYGLFIPADKVTVTPYNKDGFRPFNSVEEFESVFKPKSIISVAFKQDGIEYCVRVVYVKSEYDEDNVALFVPIEYNGNNKQLTDEEINELISYHNNKNILLRFSYNFLFKTYRYKTDDGLKYFGVKD